jgi:hypothetical protein
MIANWRPGDPDGDRHRGCVRQRWENLRPYGAGQFATFPRPTRARANGSGTGLGLARVAAMLDELQARLRPLARPRSTAGRVLRHMPAASIGSQQADRTTLSAQTPAEAPAPFRKRPRSRLVHLQAGASYAGGVAGSSLRSRARLAGPWMTEPSMPNREP